MAVTNQRGEIRHYIRMHKEYIKPIADELITIKFGKFSVSRIVLSGSEFNFNPFELMDVISQIEKFEQEAGLRKTKR